MELIKDIEYMFVICTRYRRKAFTNDEIISATKRLLELDIPGMSHLTWTYIDEKNQERRESIKIADKGIIAISADIKEEHIILWVNSNGKTSPSKIIYYIKHVTSKYLVGKHNIASRKVNLWLGDYLVSTKGISEESIKLFVESQRKRPRSNNG